MVRVRETSPPALLLFIAFTVICGGIYPLLVTGIAQAVFSKQAAGSFITDGTRREVGSRLLGQPFSDDKYFWPRPPATSDFGYYPMGSSGSNAGLTNPDYLKTVAGRVQGLREAGVTWELPADLVQASGSGLDPQISPQSALVQVARVAKARGMGRERVGKVVREHTEGRQFGFLGEPRVNVLELNLALDAAK
ncbi:potassium-transporting ATPase subunit KdpC [Geomonas ferrireducens]|uniref:potassium-transporting ATPase subunit KdpC n=1 Tax=Geomonas ferrireducens TaxID=2570227 RepID=UPI0010A8DCFC|nr:potassium-transporting ATPase subunit KdpC [Geomonas ferrireducens]